MAAKVNLQNRRRENRAGGRFENGFDFFTPSQTQSPSRVPQRFDQRRERSSACAQRETRGNLRSTLSISGFGSFFSFQSSPVVPWSRGPVVP